MPSQTKATKTALGFLDGFLLEQQLVHQEFTETERSSLRLIEQYASNWVESNGYQGMNAVIARHVTLCVLEVISADAPEDLAEIHHYVTTQCLALIHALASKRYNIEIGEFIETLNEEKMLWLRQMPIIVRRRLVWHAIVQRYPHAPLQFMAWLCRNGVIPSSRYEDSTPVPDAQQEAAQACRMVCEFDIWRNNFALNLSEALTSKIGGEKFPLYFGLSPTEPSINHHQYHILMTYRDRIEKTWNKNKGIFNQFPVGSHSESNSALDMFNRAANCVNRPTLFPGTAATKHGLIGCYYVGILRKRSGNTRSLIDGRDDVIVNKVTTAYGYYMDEPAAEGSCAMAASRFLQSYGITCRPPTLHKRYKQSISTSSDNTRIPILEKMAADYAYIVRKQPGTHWFTSEDLALLLIQVNK